MTPLAQGPSLSTPATFVDDFGLLLPAPDVPAVVSLFQSDLNARLDPARFLNIRLAPAKPDLLLLIPMTSNRPPSDTLPSILLGPH